MLSKPANGAVQITPVTDNARNSMLLQSRGAGGGIHIASSSAAVTTLHASRTGQASKFVEGQQASTSGAVAVVADTSRSKTLVTNSSSRSAQVATDDAVATRESRNQSSSSGSRRTIELTTAAAAIPDYSTRNSNRVRAAPLRLASLQSTGSQAKRKKRTEQSTASNAVPAKPTSAKRRAAKRYKASVILDGLDSGTDADSDVSYSDDSDEGDGSMELQEDNAYSSKTSGKRRPATKQSSEEVREKSLPRINDVTVLPKYRLSELERPAHDLFDAEAMKVIASYFKTSTFLAESYLASDFYRHSSSASDWLHQCKYWKLSLNRIISAEHCLYIRDVLTEATTRDTGRVISGNKSADCKLRQSFDMSTNDNKRNKLYWVTRNIVELAIAAGALPDHVHACSGDGTIDSVTILINKPTSKPQRFHYDFKKEHWTCVNDDESNKNNFNLGRGKSLFFNWSCTETQFLDIKVDHDRKTRRQITIEPSTILIIDASLKHAGPANSSATVVKRMFLYCDPCDGFRNTHVFHDLLPNGKQVEVCENGIYFSEHSEEEDYSEDDDEDDE